MSNDSDKDLTPPKCKKRMTSFSSSWLNTPQYSDWIKKKDNFTASCKFCLVDVSVKYAGVNALEKHIATKKHQHITSAKAVAGSLSHFTNKNKDTSQQKLVAQAELMSWSDIESAVTVLQLKSEVNIDELYTEYCYLRNVYEKLPKDKPNDKIWSAFFCSMQEHEVKNLKKLCSFVFSIPISNYYCEKVFSVLNNLYTKERNRMALDLMKAELIIRLNLSETCKTFNDFLKTPQSSKLLEAVNSNTKYM